MPLTRNSLAAYLSHRLGRPVTVEEFVRFPRGTSRETWFLGYRVAERGPPIEWVLRTDHPNGSVDPTPLEQEYFIYERLGRTSVPHARTLWWEDDPRWTDRPFYVRERIAGDWKIAHYSDPDPAYDSLRVDAAREHLRKLALVHGVDWRSLSLDRHLPAPDNEADAAHNYVRSLRGKLEGLRAEAIPIAFEACEWLHDHAPAAPRLCLCKGTNGYGEEVFRGGEIVAMSDWEEVSIGDPAADFAFMQGFLEPIERHGRVIWGLQEALDYYASVSGIRITPQAVAYYQVIRCLRLLVLAHNSGAALSRPGATIRQAWTGTEVLHMTKHVLASAMGWLPPCSPARFAELNDTVEGRESGE